MTSELPPHSVAADSTGRVYVLDGTGMRVIVLSPDGNVLETFGRRGAGPGELAMPIALTVEPGGEIAVYDYGRGGLVRWSADGEPLDLVRIESGFWGPKLKVTRGGVVFTALVTDDGAGETSRQRLARWSPDGEVTVTRLEREADRPADFPTCRIRGIPVAPLFAPELVWDAEGDLLAVNAGAAYAIDIHDGKSLTRSVRRDMAPRRVDREMALREVGDGMPIPVANCVIPPEEVVRGRGYVDVLPAVMNLAISPAGELWVLRGRVADEPAAIDIFSSDGRYVGTLPTGAPFPSAFMAGGRIVSAERDGSDVPRLAAYDVHREERPSNGR